MVKDMVDMEVEDLNVVDMDMVDISKSRTFLAQFGLVAFHHLPVRKSRI